MSQRKRPDINAMNIVDVTYDQSGKSVATNELGMREMQARVWEHRDARNLLIKAPPASGKSRALMFIALDKLFNQGRKKVIVAVPERSIGGSFGYTDLKSHGFFADWEVKPENDLCKPGSTASTVEAFRKFMAGPDATLVCTHATLRYAFDALSPEDFNGCVLAIDEFHHVSADLDNNRLGTVLRDVMAKSDVHVIAMTGSYFRGDSVPVLTAEDEAKFTPVTFNYYDQLNGYQHLKSLGIGHHFYQGSYTDSVGEALDLDRKTIIHIPSVNSGDSTKDKYEEVGLILDAIGEVVDTDEHGIHNVRRKDNGAILRVADLVDDQDPKQRAEVVHYLTTVASKDRDAVDIIIALGMAKEGFDWPFAEDALTIGYRASLTEIIQIIGRVTRDSAGKEHAQFTNLIAQPDADTDEVTVAVNNMLKAITASLLMEQVLAPNFKFKAKKPDDAGDGDEDGIVKIDGFKEPSTARVQQIVDTDLGDLKATILQDVTFAKAAAGGMEPETTNKVLIPRIIRERYPDLSEEEVEEVRQQVVVDSVIKNGEVREVGDDRFIRMADKFVKIEDININLIDSINPFQKAFEIMSKSVDTKVLKTISDVIAASKVEVTEEEAIQAVPKIKAFVQMNGRRPDHRSDEPTERRLGEITLWLQAKKRERKAATDE
ncbi:ATP-dependent helicase [Corynebacterium falsenii]|uniref:ATP-dependent helicase n=1 Tax=Corynebacterium falsenii TaxID=108486 RepID=A0A418Q4G6_9CORY|nr:DEAD/DEAH box helicase [Corynebacterium falsenii]RIX33177.1 ATP-dependent helicase [Corynebacterium falsenii]